MTSNTTSNLITEAKAVQQKLQQLWADEGVEQLEIFLDPGIFTVLAEIKKVSLDFIGRVAELED
ncbi:MAG: hypothetical protein J5I90_06195 [Caldilineales bacterium]|nr:hypothetical protein [Caldilineales bacterium]